MKNMKLSEVSSKLDALDVLLGKKMELFDEKMEKEGFKKLMAECDKIQEEMHSLYILEAHLKNNS